MRRHTAKADVIPVRQPNQYACVTTSLAMALRALGVPEDECSVERVNKVVGAMPLQGAAWEPMLAAANHYGMRATLTLPSTVRQLKQWTDAGIPVVIAWNPEGREWSHASLVFDVDDDLNVYIADPNIPDPEETVRVVPKAEFYSKWYEKSPQGFLIRRPACAIEREITPEGRQVMASRKKSRVARHPLVDMAINFAKNIGQPMKLAELVGKHGKANMEAAMSLAIESGELSGRETSRATTALLQIQRARRAGTMIALPGKWQRGFDGISMREYGRLGTIIIDRGKVNWRPNQLIEGFVRPQVIFREPYTTPLDELESKSDQWVASNVIRKMASPSRVARKHMAARQRAAAVVHMGMD